MISIVNAPSVPANPHRKTSAEAVVVVAADATMAVAIAEADARKAAAVIHAAAADFADKDGSQ